MTHQDCQDRLLDLAYGELGSEETAEMQAHLASCQACRAELVRLGGIRVAMRQLEPELPPEHGEHLLLTAARHAVESRRSRHAFLPPWVWRWSLTVAALAVVGTVSFRILSVRDRPLSREIEGRPETFAVGEQKAAPTVAGAPAPSTTGPAADALKQPASPPSANMAKAAVPEKARQYALAPPKEEKRRAESTTGKGQIAEARQRPDVRTSPAPASAGFAAAPPRTPAARSDQASASIGSVAESQRSVGRGPAPRSPAADEAAQETLHAPEERQVQAEAEAPRDQLAGDSRKFAQPPDSAKTKGESIATSRLGMPSAPAAKPAPTAEEKRKKTAAPEPLMDSAGSIGGADKDQGARTPGSAPSPAGGTTLEQTAPGLGYLSSAEPSPATPEAPLLTAKTWQRDRRVRAVQSLVQEIDEAQRQRKFAEHSRPFQACGPDEDAERRLYTLEGRTVKYVRQKGYRDLALTIEQFYDGQGRLRYVFIHGGAVNGAVVDHRLWLDEQGQRLWETQKWRRGRYPLPEVWPDQDLTRQAPSSAALECGAP